MAMYQYENVECISILVSPRRKLVAQIVNKNKQLRLDLRYWSIWDGIDDFMPMRKNALNVDLEHMKRLIPQLTAMINKY